MPKELKQLPPRLRRLLPLLAAGLLLGGVVAMGVACGSGNDETHIRVVFLQPGESDVRVSVIVYLDRGKTQRVESGREVLFIRLSPDGQRVAALQDAGGEPELAAGRFGAPLAAVATLSSITGVENIQWSPDGARLAVFGTDEVALFETGTWSVIGRASLPAERGTALVTFGNWSPDGRLLALPEAVAVLVVDSSGGHVALVALSGSPAGASEPLTFGGWAGRADAPL